MVNAEGIKHTHGMITLKWLRDVYASELLASRRARKMGPQYFAALRFGMEFRFLGYAARIDVTNSLANDAEFDELQQLTLEAKDRLSGGEGRLGNTL